MADEIPVDFPSPDKAIPGSHPVVVIGPNGSGKTRFGAEVADVNDGERISALRNPIPSGEIQQETPENARREVEKEKRQAIQKPWQSIYEINELLTKFMAEDQATAMQSVTGSSSTSSNSFPDLKLKCVQKLWHKHFPERKIDITSHVTSARNQFAQGDENYKLREMSEGEKGALYLITRVVDADPGIVVVDEPGLHLHPVLARRLWDDLEEIREDCRFIYLTHDLPFARSRKNSQFIVMRPGGKPQVLPREKQVPEEIIESVFGAATFSVTASTVVLCEGKRDQKIYEAWFNGEDTAVIELEGVISVIKSTRSINEYDIVRNIDAIGIIDRDDYPDDKIDDSPSYIHYLDVREVENVLCIPKLFKALARHFDAGDPDELYDTYIDGLKDRFEDSINDLALERAKRRAEYHLSRHLNSVDSSDDIVDIQKEFRDKITQQNLPFNVSTIVHEEKERLKEAKESDDSLKLLKYVKGGDALSDATRALGLGGNNNRLINAVIEGLTNSSDDDFRTSIEEALSEHFPSL